MSQSKEHKMLVKQIVEYLSSANHHSDLTILSDHHTELEHPDKPPVLDEGPQPDVYAFNSKTLYIGEAKTPNDINNEHTYTQITAYLRHIRNQIGFLGMYESGKIILNADISYTHEFQNIVNKRFSEFTDQIIILTND